MFYWDSVEAGSNADARHKSSLDTKNVTTVQDSQLAQNIRMDKACPASFSHDGFAFKLLCWGDLVFFKEHRKRTMKSQWARCSLCSHSIERFPFTSDECCEGTQAAGRHLDICQSYPGPQKEDVVRHGITILMYWWKLGSRTLLLVFLCLNKKAISLLASHTFAYPGS